MPDYKCQKILPTDIVNVYICTSIHTHTQVRIYVDPGFILLIISIVFLAAIKIRDKTDNHSTKDGNAYKRQISNHKFHKFWKKNYTKKKHVAQRHSQKYVKDQQAFRW